MSETKYCPYCNGVMEKGYIKCARQQLVWSEKNIDDAVRFNWTVKDGEVKLGDFGFFRGAIVEAYNCWDCKKIVIDYDEEYAD